MRWVVLAGLVLVGCGDKGTVDYDRPLECEPGVWWPSADHPQPQLPASCDPLLHGRDFQTVPYHVRNETGEPIVVRAANTSLSPAYVEVERLDGPGRFPVDCFDGLCEAWAMSAASSSECSCGLQPTVLIPTWAEPTAIVSGQWQGALAVPTGWEPACGEPCASGECWRYVDPPAGRYRATMAFTRGADCTYAGKPCNCNPGPEGTCHLTVDDGYEMAERVSVDFDYPTGCPGIEFVVE